MDIIITLPSLRPHRGSSSGGLALEGGLSVVADVRLLHHEKASGRGFEAVRVRREGERVQHDLSQRQLQEAREAQQ